MSTPPCYPARHAATRHAAARRSSRGHAALLLAAPLPATPLPAAPPPAAPRDRTRKPVAVWPWPGRSFARWLPRWRARAASEDSSRRHRLLPHAASIPLRPAPRTAPPPAALLHAAPPHAAPLHAAPREHTEPPRAALLHAALLHAALGDACRGTTTASVCGRPASRRSLPSLLTLAGTTRWWLLRAVLQSTARNSRHLEVLLEAFD